MSISILILTKNEQQDLPACLESVAWSDDIHVYDSMSTDDTVAIAEKFGAKVTQRGYGENKPIFGGDEAAHRNWGLQNIPFKHQWVLTIDADERVTPELLDSIQQTLNEPKDYVAFSIQRRDFFMNTWLKHVQTSPFYIRLFKPEKISYKRCINCNIEVEGNTGKLSGYLDHYPFSKGIAHWLNRHNFYSTSEAEQTIKNRTNHQQFSVIKAFFERDFHKKRFHQKELFYRLPARPLIKFFILYILKKGFLDGKAGLTYAILQSIYEYFIVLKVRELEQKISSHL